MGSYDLSPRKLAIPRRRLSQRARCRAYRKKRIAREIAAKLERYDGVLCERCGSRRFTPHVPPTSQHYSCIECHWSIHCSWYSWRIPAGVDVDDDWPLFALPGAVGCGGIELTPFRINSVYG
jgi:hypothetical protein